MEAMSIFYSGDEEYGDDITSGNTADNTLEDRKPSRCWKLAPLNCRNRNIQRPVHID